MVEKRAARASSATTTMHAERFRLREAEKTGSLISTESDQFTPREEPYRGEVQTNGVYGFVFFLHAAGSSNGNDCHQWE